MTAVSLVLPGEQSDSIGRGKLNAPLPRPLHHFSDLLLLAALIWMGPPSHSVWAPRLEVTSPWLCWQSELVMKSLLTMLWRGWDSLLKASGKESKDSGCGERLSFEFPFLPPSKDCWSWKVILIWGGKKKDSQAKFNHWKGRMLLPVPASSAFQREICAARSSFWKSSQENILFFCLTNHPFCAVWVQWQVTWNLQESYFKPSFFVPNV